MPSLLKCWEAISRCGTGQELNASNTKRLILTNRLGIIAVFFTLPYIIGFFYFGYTTVATISCLCCVVYLSVPLLNIFNFNILSKLVLYFGVLVHQFILASIFGESAGIHIIYIALILLPIVLFEIKDQLGWILFCGLIIVFATLLLYFTKFSLFSVSDFPKSVVYTMEIAYKITTVVGCFIILFSSIKVAEETEKVLDDSNLFLQYQMKAIFDNSHDAIFLADTDMRQIVKINKRSIELFEVDSEQDLIGKYGLDLYKIPPSIEELAQLRNALDECGSYQGEFLFKTWKGNEFWGAIAIKSIDVKSQKYFAVRITDVTVQHELTSKIKSSLLEKEILLAEIHHRVKNNLAVINSLLRLQSSQIENEEAKHAFEECRNRIHTMALIHDKLYHHETLSTINFAAYINDLVGHIKSTYKATGTDIAFNVICNEMYIGIRLAVPCGLILNELISNAHKHAFVGKEKGEVKISCTKVNDLITMAVSDDGLGFDMRNALISPASLGLTLIAGLVDQINGNIVTTCENGTAFYIDFKI